ncbi:MAG: aldo/keto reductase [Verrucomicrobiota bacterium]
MKTLNWGILAPGTIANHFAAGVNTSHAGKLVAAASRNSESAQQFAKKHRMPKAYGSYDELLSDPEIDAVYIANPHVFHAEWAVKSAEAGKHVLCEKPVGINFAEAMAIVEAAEANAVAFMEAYMYRCHPQTAKVCELVRSGVIGDIRVIQATFSFGGGSSFDPERRVFDNALAGGGILDVGGYPLSFARLIAGVANGQAYANPISFSSQGVLVKETGVDGYAVADLKFEGEILAQISTGVRVSQQNYARVYGSKGWIEIQVPWIISREGGDWAFDLHIGSDTERITGNDPRGLYGMEADHFASLVFETDSPVPGITPQETLDGMQQMDLWRSQIGLEYESEKIEANIPTVTRRPLAVKDHNHMKYGELKGLEKRPSRFVLGLDNQRTLPHMSIMCDDFIERGGNTFDTAWIYGAGLQEKLLGAYLRNRGNRDQIVIVGKGGHTPKCNPADAREQLMASLDRLQTDHIDVYMLHRDNLDIPVDEFVDMYNDFADQGLIQVFGGSNWTLERVKAFNEYAAAKGKRGFSLISNNFSLARMVDPVWAGCLSVSDAPSRAFLLESGIANFAWSSQARGFFTERSAPDKTEDGELVRCWYSENNFRRKERAIELAEKYDVAPISIAAAFVLCQPFNSFSLIGPRFLKETRTSMPAMDIDLTPAELAYLNLE